MSRRLRVMQAYQRLRPTTNPYIVQLDRALGSTAGMEHLRFTWRRALLGRYDVLHLHWPETRLGGSNRVKAIGNQVRFALLLLRLRLSRIAVVRTVHNVELPQDITRIQRALLVALERATTLRIVINETTTLPADQPVETILHGHYRDWFAEFPASEATPGRFGYAGLIRRYKGVEHLVTTFRELAERGRAVSLTVGGRPSTTELAETITELAADDDRIRLELHFLSDAELVTIMTSAELVVLPYRFMHNSGGTLAALSLDRPVLIPANETNAALAAEVGPGWIHTYEGELTADDLDRTLTLVQAGDRSPQPDLSARDWADAGTRHLAAFGRAATLRRATGRNRRGR